jgi:hypothetical protein
MILKKRRFPGGDVPSGDGSSISQEIKGFRGIPVLNSARAEAKRMPLK